MKYGKDLICVEEHSEHFYILYLSVDGGKNWESCASGKAYSIDGAYLLNEEFIKMFMALLDLGYRFVPGDYRRQRLGLVI